MTYESYDYNHKYKTYLQKFPESTHEDFVFMNRFFLVLQCIGSIAEKFEIYVCYSHEVAAISIQMPAIYTNVNHLLC